MPLELISEAFESGQPILTRFTCEGDNVSPPLAWRRVPPEAKTLALIVDDPDAPKGPFSHWVVYNIPVEISELAEGTSGNLPQGTMEGRNSFGNTLYEGPCPPRGSEHQYFFRLFALDAEMELGPGATREQVLDYIQDHGIENTELQVHYAREPVT